MTNVLQNDLTGVLTAGEEILWQGRVKPFGYFEGEDGKKAIKTMLLGVLIMGGLLAAYLFAVPEREVKIVVILAVILAIVVGTPFLRFGQIRKQVYAATNRRVLVWNGKNVIGAMKYKDINATEVFHREKDAGTLVLGKALIEEGTKQLRWRSCNPLADEGHIADMNAKGLVLYHIPAVEDAIQVIENAKV